MLYSVIDIGSNTVKIAVLDTENIFRQAPVFFKAIPFHIKSKIENNRLLEKETEELAEVIASFGEISGRLTKNPPIAFATASLRGLENLEEVLSAIRKKSGIPVSVISGETEAYYSFLGARGCVSARAGISVDLGGGSTELLAFRKNTVLKAVSLPFGCLTLYQMFFEDGKCDIPGCRAFVREKLKKSAPRMPGSSILLSGGSAKAVLRYKNFLEEKHNFTIQRKQFDKIEEHFLSGDLKERKKMEEVLKDRFRLIPPALIVFSEIAAHYRKDQLFVCRSGVREGCLLEFLEKKV